MDLIGTDWSRSGETSQGRRLRSMGFYTLIQGWEMSGTLKTTSIDYLS